MNATLKSTLALVVLLLVGALSVHGLIPDDPDGDGVPDPEDLCPLEDASGFDRNGDGCIDDGSGARHIEYWGWVDSVVTYVINELGAPGVAGNSDLDAVEASFDAWTSIPGTELEANLGGTVPQAVANGLDKVNLVTFSDATYLFGFTTLAVGLTTSFEADTLVDGRLYRPGEIFDADMIFNPLYPFGTSGSPAVRDIQSVATHEAGHILGLSHAAIGTSTMYFVLPGGLNARSLEDDDVAVYLKAYGSDETLTNSSRLEGTVTHGQTGLPIPGAIVYVINEATGDTSACDFTLPEDGDFTFIGLADGDYFVSIHPLDGTAPIGHMTAGNINALLVATAQTNFMAESYDAAESNTDDPNDRTAVAVSDGDITTVAIISNIDAEAPTVLSANPPNGTMNAAIDGAYVIEFSERIDVGTITDAFSFRDAMDSGIAGNLAIIRDDSVVVFTPSSPLAYGTAHTLRFDTDLTDLAGNPLEADFELDIVTELEPALDILSLAPNKGVVGNTVVINGHGFDNAPSVTFNGVAAGILSHGPNSIVAVVPEGATTGDVVVTNSDLEPSDAVVFTVLSASEVARGYETGTLSLLSQPNAIALGPDGEYAFIAVGGGIEAVDINPTTSLTHTLIDEPGTFVDVAASPDGKRVYALNETAGTFVEVMTDPTAEPLLFHTILASRPLGATPRNIVVDPFGYRAYVSTDEAEVQVWDIRLGSPTYQEQVSVLHAPDGISLRDVTIPPAGDRLMALGGSGEVFFYVLGPDTLTDRVSVSPDPRSINVDPQGQRAYVGDGNGNLSVLNIEGTPFFVEDIATGGSLRGFDTTPAGLYMYATDRELDNMKIVDLDQTSGTFRSVVENAPQTANPVDVAVSGDGNYAFSVLQGDDASAPRMSVTTIGFGPTMLSMYPTAGEPGTQVVITMEPLDEGTTGVEIDFNGVTAVPTSWSLFQAIVTVPPGVTTGAVTTRVTTFVDPAGQSSNPMQFTVLEPSSPNNIRLAGTLPIDHTMSSCDYLTTSIAISPSGNFLYNGCGGTNEVNVFDIRPGSPTYHQMIGAWGDIAGGGSPVADISLTADGKVAFVAGGWTDQADPRRVQTFYADPNDPRFLQRGPAVVGPDTETHIVATSPDNRIVLVALDFDGDNRIMVLDATNVSNGTTPTMVDSTSVGDRIADIVFHPTGRFAYVGLQNGLIRVFDTDPQSGTFGLGIGLESTGFTGLWSLATSLDGGTLYAYGYFFTDFYPYFINPYDLSTPSNPVPQTNCQVNLQTDFPPVAEHFRLAPQGDFAVRSVGNVGLFRDNLTCPPDEIPPIVMYPNMEFAFTPDGTHVYASNAGNATVQVYDFLDAQLLQVASGDAQEGVINEELPVGLRAQVTSTVPGAQLDGVPLTFSVLTGGGSIMTSEGPVNQVIVATDNGGFAEVALRLGPALGAQTVRVVGTGLSGSPLTFTANGNADPSTIPMSLAQIVPLDGSIDISPTTALLATFSRAVDPTTITSSSFYLREAPTGPALPATFGFTDSNRKVSVTPSASLDVATVYEIVLTAGITASGGPVLSNPGVSDFTTLAAQPLTLASVWPPSGLAGIPVTLSGTGFDSDFADNTVLFNGVAAIPFEGTSDVLRVVVPLTATTGTVHVVTTSGTSNTVAFTVLEPSTTTIDDVIANIGTSSGTKSLAISADGTLCYSVGTDGDVVIPVDIENATTFPSIAVGDQPVAIVMHPGGTFAYVANFNSGTVSVIDVNPLSADFNTVVETINVGTNPIDLAITADGDRLAVANAGSSDVSIVDTDESSVTYSDVLGTVPTQSGTKSVAYSGDGTLYVGTDTEILILQTTGASYEVLGTVPTQSGTKSMAISGDGTLLFALTDDGDLLVIDINDESPTENSVLGTVPTQSGSKSLAISGDGTLLYLVQEGSDEVLVYELEVIPGVGVINPDGVAPSFTIAVHFVKSLATGSDPADIAVDPSGSGRLVVTNPGDKTITIYGKPFELVEAYFKIVPGIIIPKLNGFYVLGVLQLPAPYSVHDIDISTIRVFDTVHVAPGKFYFDDVTHDGIDDVSLLFCRDEFIAAMPENGEYVNVVVKGVVGAEEFEADDTIRVLRPTITKPEENERVNGGAPYTLQWTTPLQTLPCDAVKIEWRPDGDDPDDIDCDFHGQDDMDVSEDIDQVDLLDEPANQSDDGWVLVANYVPNDGNFDWMIPAGYYPNARLRITLLWFGLKVGSSEVPFTIDSPVTVRLKSFDVAMEDGTAVLRWETSLEMGMEGYQIVRSEAETGRYDAITKELIRSSGEATGGSYEYRDESVTANRTYWYKLREVADDGLGSEYGPYSVTYRLTNQLDQNVPNPFNPTTTIRYAIASDNDVSLVVYDVSGRKVRTLVNERQKADVHRVVWDGVNDTGERVASGVYFYRLVAGKFTQTKKMLLLK